MSNYGGETPRQALTKRALGPQNGPRRVLEPAGDRGHKYRGKKAKT